MGKCEAMKQKCSKFQEETKVHDSPSTLVAWFAELESFLDAERMCHQKTTVVVTEENRQANEAQKVIK